MQDLALHTKYLCGQGWGWSQEQDMTAAGLAAVLITKFTNLPSHQEHAREEFLHNMPDSNTACVKWWICIFLWVTTHGTYLPFQDLCIHSHQHVYSPLAAQTHQLFILPTLPHTHTAIFLASTKTDMQSLQKLKQEIMGCKGKTWSLIIKSIFFWKKSHHSSDIPWKSKKHF